jgi:hypothetical protein
LRTRRARSNTAADDINVLGLKVPQLLRIFVNLV